MNKYLSILFGFIFCIALSFAQTSDFDLAYDAYAEGNYEESVELYSSYIDQNFSINAHYNRGLAYHKLGDYHKAINDYDFVIKEDPKDPETFYSRAKSYYELDDYQNALKDNQMAIKLNPKYADAYTNLGLCYDKLGDDDGAIEQYTKALDLEPSSATDYYNRALSYQNIGEYTKSQSDYDNAIRIDWEDPDYFWGRADLYYELEDYDACISDYNQAIALDNTISSLFYNRGIAYYDLENYEKAIPDFEEADYLYGGDIDAKWYVVLSAKESGDNEKALDFYEEVERIDPHYEYLRYVDKNELKAKNGLDSIVESAEGNNLFYIIALVVLVLIAIVLFAKLYGGKNDDVRKYNQ